MILINHVLGGMLSNHVMVGIGVKLFRLSNSGISKNQICCPNGFDDSICPEGNLLNLTTVPGGREIELLLNECTFIIHNKISMIYS